MATHERASPRFRAPILERQTLSRHVRPRRWPFLLVAGVLLAIAVGLTACLWWR